MSCRESSSLVSLHSSIPPALDPAAWSLQATQAGYVLGSEVKNALAGWAK